MPVIGAVKYADEAAALAKGITKYGDEAVEVADDILKNADEIEKIYNSSKKAADAIPDGLGKNAAQAADAAEDAAWYADDAVKQTDRTGNLQDSFGAEGAGDKADILAQNRAQGRAYEQKSFIEFNQNFTHSQEQITVKTQSSVKTRLDAIGFDTDGKIVIHEFKSSTFAPLTKNQKSAFPEIFDSGATVLGKGKGIFTGGYSIPAGTDVKVIRPPK